MRNDNKGIKVENVEPSSLSEIAGLAVGDFLLSINGNAISDEIDYMYHSSYETLDLKVKRDGKIMPLLISNQPGAEIGIGLAQSKVKTCQNKCIFCFVGQLPKGLRRTLYVKDEDYRLSFLYGNYITMTNLSEDDKRRIVEMRLSPLYISVHTTDDGLRRRMLGNHGAAEILKELKFLKQNKIRFHVQIVMCPGYNDGEQLKKTLTELHPLYPFMESIAVVPVGLTEHRRLHLRPVEKADAEATVKIIESFSKKFSKKHGEAIVYGSDELYIKAEMPFPELKEYGELPQIENGVGLVPLFMHEAKFIRVRAAMKDNAALQDRKFALVTGKSFYPYLKRYADRFVRSGIRMETHAVENHTFGKSVTVTGLLSGKDIIRGLMGNVEGCDAIFIPDVTLRDDGDVFLDDLKPSDIESALNVKVVMVESTPAGLLNAVKQFGA